MTEKTSKWRFAVDRGGTFTDVVALDPGGVFHTLKLLSASSAYEDASIEGIRRILGLAPGEPLPEDRIESIRFGTTAATNALLERKGGRVALLITRGFPDLLEIGYQDRPEIFRLCIKKCRPLYSSVLEADERMGPDGRVIRRFNPGPLRDEVGKLREQGVDTAAVVFMHSWINPEHELLCAELLKEHGFPGIFLSHRTVNLIKMVSRGQSTLVDAYLSSVLAIYLEGIRKETGSIPLEFMQSSGVLSPPDSFTGKNAVLSGPAGGVVAVAETALRKELTGAIGFDMGGTSTDVSRFDGGFRKVYEKVIAGIPLQTEMLDIITVAAGGGSILGFDGQKMTAGPESAGSYPGPACYGFGGPLTVTDANLLTGRLIPAYFPETFGPDRRSPINSDITREKFLDLTREINSTMGTRFSAQEIAAGFLRIADEKMAMAVREISVSRGFDVRRYALVCFGGAGGQHACPIASILDIDTVVIHPLSGVMSAYGIGLSRPARKAARTVLKPYTPETHREAGNIFRALEAGLPAGRKTGEESFVARYEMDLRPLGAETYLTVEYGSFGETLNTFRQQYHGLFGFSLQDTPLEIVNLRVEVQEPAGFFMPYSPGEKRHPGPAPVPDSYHGIFYPDGPAMAPVYLRDALPPLTKITGPAFIIDDNFTVIVDPGFKAETDETGVIVMKRVAADADNVKFRRRSAGPDPVLLEVFNNLFMGTAAEMGITLRNTAHSVNMKERLDFSCAVFDSRGNLVANAPHIPVHLGSMADTVRALLQDRGGTMRPGDVYLTNNPYRGGSHLPDMTVVCPVFSEKGEIIFFTAARGHHSDVGGTTPGSMPPSATHIIEEGVLADAFLLVRDNRFREDALKDLLLNHRYPARNVPERLLDLRAQTAACRKGVRELRHITGQYGLSTVLEYMQYIQENSEYSVKKALHEYLGERGSFRSAFEDYLDDGTPLKVSVTIEGGDNPPGTLKAVIDFTGTGGQHMKDNLNAPLSVTRSAVMYVLRLLIDRDIPLNSGCLNPVEILIPEGTVLSPVHPAPVASGNVETSQRVVDLLLGAFGIAAASQGTMNNLLFEVRGEPPYYETIAGGAGAAAGCPGASGVQVHMTNTRITDPEILEFRHPGIRLEQFRLRKGSGGRGRFRGGDGVIREIKFLGPAAVSIISERRVYAPYGIKGGGPGMTGENLLKSKEGKTTLLGHREALRVDAGDSIVIRTPGGGGYGSEA